MQIITSILGLFVAAVLSIPATHLVTQTKKEKESAVPENVIVMAQFALTDEADRLNPNNYKHSPLTPTCSPGTLEICYIKAEVANPEDDAEDWIPVISEDLEDEITDLFNTHPGQRSDTPNIKLRDS